MVWCQVGKVTSNIRTLKREGIIIGINCYKYIIIIIKGSNFIFIFSFTCFLFLSLIFSVHMIPLDYFLLGEQINVHFLTFHQHHLLNECVIHESPVVSMEGWARRYRANENRVGSNGLSAFP